MPDGRLADRKNDLVHPNIGEFLAAAFLDYKNPEEVEWFSEKFGYPILLMDCDYQESENVLWDRLISHNYYYKSKEICDALCFYSSYLSDNILKRAIDHFAEISDKMVEKLKNCLRYDL